MSDRGILPTIELPKFDGNISEWISFKSLFTTLIVDNQTLCPAEKLAYLRMCLTGSANAAANLLECTENSFIETWDFLLDKYHNPAILINDAIKSFRLVAPMSCESSENVERIYSAAMRIYSTLKYLDRLPNHNDFLVYLTVEKFDDKTTQAWFKHVESREPASWDQLCEFLMTRIHSLFAIERWESIENSVTSSSIVSGICLMCSGEHYLGKCPVYLKKTAKQRKDFVTANRLCFNCLCLHKKSGCRSTRGCLYCGMYHHTTLHRDITSGENPSDEKW